MQMCVGSNNNVEAWCTPKRRPKRDFHIQVIPLKQCPKWYVWPSAHKHHEEADENENKAKQGSSSSSAYSSLPTSACASTSSNDSNGPPTPLASPAANTKSKGYGSQLVKQQPSVRRGRFAVVQQSHHQHSPSLPPPQSPRVPATPAIAINGHRLTAHQQVSASAPSSDTFKILSISKKWEDACEEPEAEDDTESTSSEDYEDAPETVRDPLRSWV